MDHAVALVEAYLQINGYFTVAEYPVIESLGKGNFGVATDLDILAFRFPGAGRLIAGRGSKRVFAPDPALGIGGDTADMIIGEVKEGHAELNRNARNPDVLKTVLARFGCCSVNEVDKTVTQLISKGRANTHEGHRVRLIAFGSNRGEEKKNYSVITLGHIITFIETYIEEHWDVLRHAQFKHQALGLFMVMEKARLERDKGKSK